MSLPHNKEKIIFCTSEERNLEVIIKNLLGPKNYRNIIKEAKKEFKNFKEKPFFVQEGVFKEMLRRLNTEYPYVVLVGEPGTGKNTIIETLIKCLEDENYFKKIKSFFDKETISLIENLRKKFSNNKESNFLILPNFENPYNIKIIKYEDYLTSENDYFRVLEIKKNLEDLYKYFFVELIDKSGIKELKELYKKRKKIVEKLSEEAKISTESVVLKHFEEIEKNTSKLKSWIRSLLNYVKKEEFKENLRVHIENIFHIYLPEIINLKKELKKRTPSLKEILQERFEKDEIRINGKRYSLISFKQFVLLFPYNSYMFSPEEIFEPKMFEVYGKRVVKIKPDSFDNLIKIEPIDEGDPEESAIPHSLINYFNPPYGKIFYIEEDFHRLLEELREKGNFIKSFFMAFLNNSSKVEDDKLSIELGEHNSILLATDNQDPFIYFKEGYLRDESGLRSRIKLIEVPSEVKTSDKNIKEFLYFVFKEAEKAGITIEDDFLNYFINHFSYRDKVLVKFRDIGNFLRELFEDVKAKGRNVLDLNFLRDKIREIQDYFEYTDERILDYLRAKEKEVGKVSALAVLKSGRGGIYVPVKSIAIYKIDKESGLFEFVDKDSYLVEEDTIKGFGIVKNFIIDYLSQIPKFKEGNIPFKVSISFYDSWNKIGGPSATTAVAASIISALSKEKIYKNRFITGALELDGRICDVGSLYEKGIVVKRMKDKEKKYRNNKDNNYFDNFSFIFPLTSYGEIANELSLDPFGLNEINLYGVSRFEEAYLLLTHKNPKELNENKIYKLGKRKLDDNLNKIEDYWFKKKRKWFIF